MVIVYYGHRRWFNLLSQKVKSLSEIAKMKAIEQYLPFALDQACTSRILYKGILTFESVVEIVEYDHSNESCRALLSYLLFCFNLNEKRKRITCKIQQSLLEYVMNKSPHHANA